MSIRAGIRLAAVATALMLSAAGLVACQSAPAANAGGDLTEGKPPVAAPASDPASVTREAYQAAFDTFVNCMGDAGISVVGAHLEGAVWTYSVPLDAGDGYAKCYEAFMPIDSAWQLANEYDSPTQVALRDCLKEVGVEPAKSVDGVTDQVARSGIDPAECLSTTDR